MDLQGRGYKGLQGAGRATPCDLTAGEWARALDMVCSTTTLGYLPQPTRSQQLADLTSADDRGSEPWPWGGGSSPDA